MKKSPNVYLLNILDAIKAVKSFVANSTETEFKESELLIAAASYKMQIIGEAASHLPKTIQEKIDSPWKKMIGMRHVLVHGYDDVEIDILWVTIKNDLKVLEKEIKKYLQDHSD